MYFRVIYFNDELCNANRKYLSKSAKFLQSAHKCALCLFSIQLQQNDNFNKHFFESCKGNAFTRTYCYGNVKDTEPVNLSTCNTFLHNLISVVSNFEIWKYMRVISTNVTI